MSTGPASTSVEQPSEPTARDDLRSQARIAAVLLVWLLVVGVVLGWIWALLVPPGPLGEPVAGGVLTVESEAFASADGKFALLTVIVGLITGVGLWFFRRARGPLVLLTLAVGATGGALLTDLIGHLIDHATTSPKIAAENPDVIQHLALQVHATGLLFVEGALAVLVYGVLVAFARDDDLGRPDPSHRPFRAAADAESVPAEDGLQHAGRYGDAAGLAQQHDFPTQ